LDKSRVEIKASIPVTAFESYKSQALELLGKSAKIDGFRPGKIPAGVLEKEVGEAGLLDEMAQLAISNAYPKILADTTIDAIGRPEITLTKVAMGNDLEFTIITAVMPRITLADYKKLGKEATKKTEPVEITETEIETALLEVRQMRAHQQLHDDKVDHHDHDHTKIDTKDLPELTDDMIKTMGKFEGVEDFKIKLRENLIKEKEARIKEKNRIDLITTIIDASTIDMPDMLVDFELDKMMQQFAHDISMMGLTMEEYMKRLEKTEVQLKTEWRINAEKRAHMQLILDEIASKEKITPSAEELKTEIAKIMDMYKNTNDISEDRARAYVMQIMTNAKVFEFLEGMK